MEIVERFHGIGQGEKAKDEFEKVLQKDIPNRYAWIWNGKWYLDLSSISWCKTCWFYFYKQEEILKANAVSINQEK